ncbi:MAG: primosomal protein N' [Chloroflexi bacterium]|nr:primosomal protein N' [Chloroflexota bacterium]MDL1885029.1 primosomal protein N' [Anaerolineae bacterium CFX8]
MYAEIAVDAPVHSTFHYHIPAELAGELAPGHLVQVAFGTALQHGIVLALREYSPVEQTKPVLALLDPQPVVTPRQIELARWMSLEYLAPLGACLWLMLPPGMSGERDMRLSLRRDAETDDPTEQKIVSLLQRRGALTGRQMDTARSLRGEHWQTAVERLEKAGILHRERILKPPRARPKIVQTAALAINPNHIPHIARHLGRESRRADILEVLAAIRAERPTVEQVLTAAGASRSSLDKLVEDGLVVLHRDERPLTVSLNIPRYEVDGKLVELRKGEKDLHVLKVLARESEPLDVSWLYAQTDARLEDLKRLEEAGFIILGEKPAWRDSLAERDFIPAAAPPLTPEQRAAWAAIESAIKRWNPSPRPHLTPPPNPPAGRESGAQLTPPPGPLPEFREGEEDAPPAPSRDSSAALMASSPPAGEWEATPAPPPNSGEVGRGAENQGEGFKTRFLLHGVTGSGKTEIYLRAIELTLAMGRQAIFLVPEIALTAQTVRRVAARFPGQVAVVHSGLSDGERYDTWRRAREGLFSVVVGARSALFTPLPDVGLVILDEEHDSSYKQSPPIPPPYYHARAVAEAMMRQNDGVLILGSATPDLESVYRAGRGDLQLLTLPTRIIGHRVRVLEQSERAGVVSRYYPIRDSDALAIDLPPVTVVDMREELKAGNTSIFSRELQTGLLETLDRREQAILFINRRGAATYVFCRDCGYVALCPRCDTPLTYHRQDEALRCHLCGYQGPQPQTCPQCGSARIKYFGAGTQQVESALRDFLPGARVVRWDADTASSPAMHEAYLQRFIERQADVMVGTQMVAKGLDLPLVTLVGVVSADMGLNLPDFRAAERTFQVLTQVAGRAGRGLLGGRVVLQTYQPDHYVIRAASRHNFAGFYEQEMAYRREMAYPPFRRLARILFRHANEGKARAEAERAADYLRHRIEKMRLTGTELIGPAPCFFDKVNNDARWHLLIRAANPTLPLQGMDIARGWYVDIDPVDVL